jgi:hypothetical protein
MLSQKNAKARRASRPLYHSAKISDGRFRKVLGHFVYDHTAALTARETNLSANSVVAIFRKLRIYFTDIGQFTDFYEGQNPLAYDSDNPMFEKGLLAFHLRRVREKHGLKSPAHEPDYHFAESHWRYHFYVLSLERPSGQVHAMMFSHLLEIIRLCGPIGTRPVNRRAGLLAVMHQMEQRILWLERHGPGFRSAHLRNELKSIRSL